MNVAYHVTQTFSFFVKIKVDYRRMAQMDSNEC
jgi:hypothetical protein